MLDFQETVRLHGIDKATCIHCIFWVERSKDAEDCHRYPPSANNGWPCSETCDFCGEFLLSKSCDPELDSAQVTK